MQTQLFTYTPEIHEPNTGDVINLQGFMAQCIDFDNSCDCSCNVCDFEAFPGSVSCFLIRCSAVERQDGKSVIFKFI